MTISSEGRQVAANNVNKKNYKTNITRNKLKTWLKRNLEFNVSNETKTIYFVILNVLNKNGNGKDCVFSICKTNRYFSLLTKSFKKMFFK